MHLIVTGATGYLGSNLTRALLARGDTVTILTRTPDRLGRLTDLADRLSIQANDVEGMRSACAPGSIDAVIHTATCYGRSGESADELVDANLRLPLALARAAGTRIGRWIDIGSALPASVSPYALSKAQFAAWLAVLPATVLAPRFHLAFQHFYGPGDSPSKFTTHVVRRCLANEDLRLTAGTQRRDFLYIDDAVSAVLTVLDHAKPDGLRSDIPVGSGTAIPVRQFVEQVHSATASRTPLHFGAVPTRPDEPDVCVADPTVLRRLGWQPQVSLDHGIALTVASERALTLPADIPA